MHGDLIWGSRNQGLQHKLNLLLWKFHKLPSRENTVQTYTTPAGILEDGFATSSEWGITPLLTMKQENRGIDVRIVLHGLGPLPICAAAAPLQSAVPLQSAPAGDPDYKK